MSEQTLPSDPETSEAPPALSPEERIKLEE